MENKSIYYFKPVEELTFTDNFMFQAVLKEPEIAAELVERLLSVKVGHVEYPELEKQIAPYYSSKGVRLDVYLKDEDKVIDVELQNYPEEALGKRTRYYQSMIDIDSLMKGQDYEDLKESYILFICKYDPFSKGGKKLSLPRYTFRNLCIENSDVELNDKTSKVIYNSSAYGNEKDEKIRDFLKYVCTDSPGKDGFSNRLSALVEKIKDNDRFKGDYAAVNLHDRDLIRNTRKIAIAEGLALGEKQGASQKAVEAAKNLLRMNILSPEQIAKAVNLPLEKVLSLLETQVNS